MFGIIGQIIAKPGRRDDLVEILSEVAGGMTGCLSYVVAEDPVDDSSLWITEVWESEEAHSASLGDPNIKAAIGRGRPFISGMGERVVTRPVGGVNRPLPQHTTIAPYLLIPSAHDAIAFYVDVFGARELMRIEDNGRVVHAELGVDEAVLLIGDPGETGSDSQATNQLMPPLQLFLFINDCDETIDQAEAFGARIIERPVTRLNEGLRRGALRDPFGVTWWIASRTR